MGALSEDTRPVSINELPSAHPNRPWQHGSDVPWSFGLRDRLLYVSETPPSESEPTPNPNVNGADTNAPQGVEVPNLGPTEPPAHRFGKRAWQALSQWEGVVEEVNGEGFSVRLTPLVGGEPDFTRIEYAEFAFDELAYESDVELIAPDVRIYWTVGKRWDEAGTMMNDSFVRVKRQAPRSELRWRLAAARAAELLAEAEEQE